MSPLVLASCLFLATPSLEIVSLQKGEQYVVPLDGAFVPVQRARQIRVTCDQYKIEAELYKAELKRKESKTIWWWIPVALVAGFAAGWGVKTIK